MTAQSTRVPAGAQITELQIARAEAAANEATVRYELHEDAHVRRRARMTDAEREVEPWCLACRQLSDDEFEKSVVWESLVRERVRQQPAAVVA